MNKNSGRIGLFEWTARLGVVFVFAFILIAVTGVNAAVNEQINYQGRLLDSNGAAVPDGSYNIRFKVYEGGDGDLGGGDETLKWTETRQNSNSQGVTVKNGYFSVNLGSVNSFNTDIDWNNDTLWLSVDVGGTSTGASPTYDGEMDPFKRLAANPYSLNSKFLGGLQSGDFVQLAQGLQADSSTSNASIAVNKTGGTADIVDLQRSGSTVFQLDNAGAALFQTQTDSTTGFQIKDADGGTSVLNVDTTNERVGIGDDSPASALTVGASDAFQVNSSGAIAAATGITSAGTVTFSGLNCTANANGGAITANGSGVLSCSDDNAGVSIGDTIGNSPSSGGIVYSDSSDHVANDKFDVGDSSYYGGLITGHYLQDSNLSNAPRLEFLDLSGVGAPNMFGYSVNNHSGSLNFVDVNTLTSYWSLSYDPATPSNRYYTVALANGTAGTPELRITTSSIDTYQPINVNSQQINGLADPTNDQDAATKIYVDNTVDAVDIDSLLPAQSGHSGEFLTTNGSSASWGSVSANVTLQDAYDETSGNTITTTDNRNLTLNLADTSTDSDFIVNLQGTGNTFEIQDGGTPGFIFEDGGNIGVGVSDPVQKLDVAKGAVIGTYNNTVNNYTINSTNRGTHLYTSESVSSGSASGVFASGIGPGSAAYTIPTLGSYGTAGLVGAALNGSGTRNSTGIYGFTGQETTSTAGTNNGDAIYGLAKPAAISDISGGTWVGVKGTADISQPTTLNGSPNAVGGYFTATSKTGGNATGLYATASGGSNNFAAIFGSGNVGIGDSSPAALLTVGSSDAFQINNSGQVTAGTWNGTALTDAYVSDTLTASNFVGSGSSTTAVDLGTAEVSGTLSVSKGGTGASSLSDLITLGTHTTGNYVANVTGNSQISVGGSAGEGWTPTLSIAADSIGDSQLAYNTGQNLTTSSSPAFAGLTTSGHVAFGSGSSVNGLTTGADTLANVTSNNGVLQAYETSTLSGGSTTRYAGTSTLLKVDPSSAPSYNQAFGTFSGIEVPSGNSQNFSNLLAGSGGVTIHAGSGTVSQATGFVNNVLNLSNSGTITSAVGQSVLLLNANSTFTGGGTVGTFKGVEISTPINLGTVTNNYGVYINDQSGTGSTNSYNFYSAGSSAKNYFEGKVGIGDSSPAALLTVGNGDLFTVNSSGNVDLAASGATLTASNSGSVQADDLKWENTATNGTGFTVCYTGSGPYRAVRCSSSKRFKENIEDLKIDGLETVNALRPVEYDRKSTGDHEIGFIAEEADKVDRDLVTYEDGKPLSFQYQNYTSVLTKAVQELDKKVNNISQSSSGASGGTTGSSEISDLNEKVEELTTRLNEIAPEDGAQSVQGAETTRVSNNPLITVLIGAITGAVFVIFGKKLKTKSATEAALINRINRVD